MSGSSCGTVAGGTFRVGSEEGNDRVGVNVWRREELLQAGVAWSFKALIFRGVKPASAGLDSPSELMMVELWEKEVIRGTPRPK